MKANHHPDDATLLSYAAASLPEAFDVLVACHLQNCSQCQQRVAVAEQLGGLLLETTETIDADRRERFAALLDVDFMASDSMAEEVTANLAPVETDHDIRWRKHYLPEELQAAMAGDQSSLAWRRLVPGIQHIKLNSLDGELRLLKIQPGISIPLHSHTGSELTLILEGSYSDELGRFTVGDVADLDGDVDHQPITDGTIPCVCLIATDAPLKFRGFLPKLLQPFTGL